MSLLIWKTVIRFINSTNFKTSTRKLKQNAKEVAANTDLKNKAGHDYVHTIVFTSLLECCCMFLWIR